MATTTAAITLTSSGLTSDALSVSSSQTLYKAGLTTGLEEYSMGKLKVPAGGTNLILIDATVAGNDKAAKVYITNKNTDATHYVIIAMNGTVIGRLYAGDWMFVPWSQTDVDADVEITAPNEINTVEYAVFHEGITFTNA